MKIKTIKNILFVQSLAVLLIAMTIFSCNNDDNNSTSKNNIGEIAYPGYSYRSNFVTLESGIQMHYLDEGTGDIPLILVHGLPTSSYLWRKMIPELSNNNRVIAIDLPNFGKSDKTGGTPCSGDYADWINEFVSVMGFTKVRLLNHDMGGFTGGLFAARHPEKVDAIAMFEVIFSGPIPESFLPPFLADLRGPQADQLITEDNYLVETLLLNNDFNEEAAPSFGRSTFATLTQEEADEFRKPFLDPNSRQALHFDRDCLGIMEIDDQNRIEFSQIATFFKDSDIPRLVLFGNPSFVLRGNAAPPGAIDPITNLPITMRNVVTGQVSNQVGGWQVTDNVSVYDMNTPSLHYWQNETNGAAEEAAVAISTWLDSL